jgi:general stress protein YciG
MADDFNPAENLSDADRSKGGKVSPENFKHNRTKARRAGKQSGGNSGGRRS